MKRLTCRARRSPLSLLVCCLLFALFVVMAAASLAGASADDPTTRIATSETPNRSPAAVMLAVVHHEADIARVEVHKAARAAAEAAAIEAARQAAEQAAQAERRRVAAAAAAEQRRSAQAVTRNRQWDQAASVVEVRGAEHGSGRCGGSLPPCGVMRNESGGDLRIWNGRCYAPFGWTGSRAPNCPRARSSASGKWQITRGTWNGYAGLLNAADATEQQQDAKAEALWADGAGCQHWSAC